MCDLRNRLGHISQYGHRRSGGMFIVTSDGCLSLGLSLSLSLSCPYSRLFCPFFPRALSLCPDRRVPIDGLARFVCFAVCSLCSFPFIHLYLSLSLVWFPSSVVPSIVPFPFLSSLPLSLQFVWFFRSIRCRLQCGVFLSLPFFLFP